MTLPRSSVVMFTTRLSRKASFCMKNSLLSFGISVTTIGGASNFRNVGARLTTPLKGRAAIKVETLKSSMTIIEKNSK